MTDELTRIKYRYMLNSIQRIKAKLKTLEQESKDLYNFTNSCAQIDDECICREDFNIIKDNFANIKTELREKLMYSVSKKI